MDGSPTKQNYSDTRERRRLGKRILKTLQPLLEDALQIEADATLKPYPELYKTLEKMMERCLEPGQASVILSREQEVEDSRDVIMVDASGVEEPEITVAAEHTGNVEDGDANDDVNGAVGTAANGGAEEGNIEVNTSSLDGANGVTSSNASIAGKETVNGVVSVLVNGVKASVTPPATNGYLALARPSQPGPPTPPQSNGSFGKEIPDVLTEGGIAWYLKAFELQGLSIVEEQWAGRDAVRSLSEELTDIDDDELKGLGRDINGGTATPSQVSGEAAAAADIATSVVAKGRASKVKKRARTSGRRR